VQWPKVPGSIRALARACPPTTELFHNNSYAHDEQGDNPGQKIKGSTVSSINLTITDILISSAKMLAALT